MRFPEDITDFYSNITSQQTSPHTCKYDCFIIRKCTLERRRRVPIWPLKQLLFSK